MSSGRAHYYTGLNVVPHSLLERWFQFRHQAGDLLWASWRSQWGWRLQGQAPADDIEKLLAYNFIETVAKVWGQGAASCFSCGYGETCAVGIPRMLLGRGNHAGDHPGREQTAAGHASGGGRRQAAGRAAVPRPHRQAVTQKVMQALMAKFEETV